MNVSALPQPGNSYRGGYDIVIEFDHVLNLPDRAKVVMDGTSVGVVTKVAVTSLDVDVVSRIDPSVVVPSNIHASLQQATVLGDIYVSLDRSHSDEPSAPPLGPGGRIPLAHTTPPPILEDTIAHLANFVSSGSIQRIQNTIIGINRVTPSEGTVHKIASQVSADLKDLSNNMDLVDQWLKGVSETAEVMHSRIPAYQRIFSADGMRAFDHLLTVMGYIGNLLPSFGSVYSNGYWLVPLFYSLGDAMGAFQHSKWAFEAEWPAWRRLFTGFFLPEDKYPAINITSIIGPDGRELSGNVQDVLRILGAAP
ncbi:mammalian cell entry protein [Mycobacterium branderi]|uniref:Mammalian cell entry protein n=1 Tax=Mycobacterium branderi TaxID=43348 RepID=A0AA91RGA2_9MYCO|nr:mammalian cell entry protein [Mycobacterium branderi]